MFLEKVYSSPMSIKMKKLQERGSKTFPITQDCHLPWPLLYVHRESIPLPQCYNTQYQKMREDKVALGKFSVPYEWVNCGIYKDPFGRDCIFFPPVSLH